jgi:hypothetical protein
LKRHLADIVMGGPQAMERLVDLKRRLAQLEQGRTSQARGPGEAFSRAGCHGVSAHVTGCDGPITDHAAQAKRGSSDGGRSTIAGGMTPEGTYSGTMSPDLALQECHYS